MSHLKRDVIVALLLLVGCGAFFVESLNIEETNYGTMQSWIWPRIILAALTLACLALLAQALRAPAEAAPAPGESWLGRYRNALVCYGLFLAFLLTLPVLGMLLGGILFVFLTLSALGRPELRLVPVHLAIAVGTIGAMWSVFTFGLRVFLPEGMLLSF